MDLREIVCDDIKIIIIIIIIIIILEDLGQRRVPVQKFNF
jgi:hypothetical protein